MAETRIEIPEPHQGLPAEVQKKWKGAYATAFAEAQNDWPEDSAMQKQEALRAANKILRVPDPSSYAEAMKLEDWHVILRAASGDGKTLRLVTRHGKKFTFPIPEKEQKPAEAKPPAA